MTEHFFYLYKFLGLFFLSFLITFLITRLFILLEKKINILDYPNHRKLHTRNISLIGGICIVVAMFISIICIYFINDNKIFIYNNYIALSFIIVLFSGFIDDKYGLNVISKLFFQFAAAIILVFNIDFIYTFNWNFLIFFDNIIFSNIISILFIVLVINAMNFIDGLDGLLLGISISIIVLFLFILFCYSLDTIMLLLIILLGNLIAMLIYNKYPAIIFLGDLGSMVLGWFFALFSFYFASHVDADKILIPIILLAFPILDLFSVIVIRFYNNDLPFFKKVINIFVSDRNHIHHIILNKFGVEKKAVYLICITSFFTSLVSLFFSLYLNDFIYGLAISLFLFLIFRKK